MRWISSALAALALLIVGAKPADADRPHQHRPVKSVRMLATAYCDRGATKSGIRAQPGVVAADLHQLPLGTKLRVIAPGESYAGVYTVLDTGSRIRGRALDIYMPSCTRAKRFGKRPVQVRILN